MTVPEKIISCISAYSSGRQLEIHVCKECFRQIGFFVDQKWALMCSACNAIFPNGHALAMHWHFDEEFDCDLLFRDDINVNDVHQILTPQTRQCCDI